MPWYKKLAAFISSAVRERDDLRVKVDVTEKKVTHWYEKASRLFAQGNAILEDLNAVKPRLEQAEKELQSIRPVAKQALSLREKSDRLESALSAERSKNQHLELSLDAMRERYEPEPEPEQRHHHHSYDDDDGYSR